MASLTETGHYSRLLIKFGGVALLVMIVGRFVWVNGYAYWKAAHPPPPTPPSVGFGILPKIEFPESEYGDVSVELETKTGSLPVGTKKAVVYLMPAARPNLLALEKSIDQAEGLGYKGSSEKVSETVYRWYKFQPVRSTLDIEIYTGNFTIDVDWEGNPEFLTEKQLGGELDSIKQVRKYMDRGGILPVDLEMGEAKVAFLKASGGDLKETVSISEADFIQVDLYRANIDDIYEVVTPIPNKGIVQAIVSGNPRLGALVEVENNYFPVDYASGETYPLITAPEAWSKLAGGEGYVAYVDPGVETAVVRRVDLAYYDDYVQQSFLQPIFVFRGDDNFVAYVAAVSDVGNN